ncbi:hypothetical protein FACS189449_13350 [Alphaproteobacteria bacterium]|nr:hypothetical protein FACS189449_13350 [Alphaproteobacteria bacterium]
MSTVYTLDATLSIKNIVEKLNALPEQISVAAMRSLNKTAAWVKSTSAKQIAKEKLLKLKFVRNRLKIKKAGKEFLQAKVLANLKGVRAKDIGPMKQTIIGAIAGQHMFAGAFVATMPKNKHTGIFKRKTKNRLPIEEQYLSIYKEASALIEKLVDEKTASRFEHYFRHEIKFATGNFL